MVPGNLSDEPLDPLPLLLMQIGDSFAGLTFLLRDQPGDVLGGMTPVLRAVAFSVAGPGRNSGDRADPDSKVWAVAFGATFREIQDGS
jgi:hypothetical protein